MVSVSFLGIGKTLLIGASAKHAWKEPLERRVSGGIVVQVRCSGLRGTALRLL